VIIVGGGAPPPDGLAALLPDPALVICADLGYRHAKTLGLTPTLVIGDLDSLDNDAVVAAEVDGVRVERHPPAKDATDLELALDAAVRMVGTTTTPVTFTVIASPDIDERIDHLLSQLGLLAAPAYDAFGVEAWFGQSLVHIVRPGPPRPTRSVPGELVTILAIGGTAEGVETDGLRYALHGDALTPFTTRGVSNVAESSSFSVSCSSGRLAVIRPHALRGPQ
jgi:thiamine pyrophosphokinase